MKKEILFIVAFAAVGLTSACDSPRSVFGEQKQAPDEFAVYSRAPLSMPPGFGLRPPQPGADRPQVVAPRNDAEKALLGNSTAAAAAPTGDKSLSPGMLALLKQAGVDQTKPGIRTLVNRETFLLSGGSDESFIDSILFWRKNQNLKGVVINPSVEAQRLRSIKANGDAVAEQAPTIVRSGGGQSERKDGRSKGFWGSLFN